MSLRTNMNPSVRDDLIIDVGMHDGEDTAFYLAKGFRVVAIEANPGLAAHANERFSEQLESGQLHVLSVAIAPEDGKAELAVARDRDIWSSLSPEFVERNRTQAGTAYEYVTVETMRFERILEDYGIPRYLKVDIEGLDMLCVRALRAFDRRPTFVSIESQVSVNNAPFSAAFDELAELWSLGYRRFAYVNQRENPHRTLPNPPLEGRYTRPAFTIDGSGPFGEEVPVRWLSIERALAKSNALRFHHHLTGFGGRWSGNVAAAAYRRSRRMLKKGTNWYDLHARRD